MHVGDGTLGVPEHAPFDAIADAAAAHEAPERYTSSSSPAAGWSSRSAREAGRSCVTSSCAGPEGSAIPTMLGVIRGSVPLVGAEGFDR